MPTRIPLYNLVDVIEWLERREAQVTFCQNPMRVMVDCYAEPLHHSCVKFIRAEGDTLTAAVNDAIDKIDLYLENGEDSSEEETITKKNNDLEESEDSSEE